MTQITIRNYLTMEQFSRQNVVKRVVKNVANKRTNVPRCCLQEFGNEPLEEEEKDVIVTLGRQMNFDEIVVMSNFKSNVNTLLPPLGYVATMYGDSPFRRDAFIGVRMFMGSAVAEVKMETSRLSDAQMEDAHANINKMVRDVSPRPPLLSHNPSGGWIESLGEAGRIDCTRRMGREERTGASSW